MVSECICACFIPLVYFMATMKCGFHCHFAVFEWTIKGDSCQFHFLVMLPLKRGHCTEVNKSRKGEMAVNRKLTRVIFVVCELSADCLLRIYTVDTFTHSDIVASTIVMWPVLWSQPRKLQCPPVKKDCAKLSTAVPRITTAHINKHLVRD